MTINTFYRKTKVAGIFFENRLAHIKKYVRQGSKFFLEREPDNEFDENAIKVNLTVSNGKYGLHIGYIPRELAAEMAPLMDGGVNFMGRFLTGIINEKNGKFIHLYIKIFTD